VVAACKRVATDALEKRGDSPTHMSERDRDITVPSQSTGKKERERDKYI